MAFETLKENILRYAKDKKYFGIDDLKKYFDSNHIKYTDESVKKYLYLFKQGNKIFDAGRGWYSSISENFILETKPIEPIINLISNQFPLLSFSCWSTEQIKSYFHHMQAKFVTFIFTESDNLAVLLDYLIEKYDNIYLNPTETEIKKSFVIKDKTFILRPSITEEPSNNHTAIIEKILIDLYLEKDRMKLISGAEYDRVFRNIISNSRINIARLLRYAKRREVRFKIKEKIH